MLFASIVTIGGGHLLVALIFALLSLSFAGMALGAAQQFSMSTRRRPAVPGVCAYASHDDEKGMLVNSDPQAAEVWTVTIATATDAELYGLNLTSPMSSSVSYLAGTSSTTTTIAAGLAAAWNADPVSRGLGRAVAAAAIITITGLVPGLAFEIEEDENAAKMTTVNTTNAAAAASVPFGRAMISPSYLANEPDRLGILAQSTKFTAQVDTLTVTYAASESYIVSITVEGVEYNTEVLATVDSATTATAIAAAINALMPANSVLAAAATNVVTLTAEVAGKAFQTSAGTATGTAARLVLANVTGSGATDIMRSIAGVSLASDDVGPLSLTDDTAAYPANSGVPILKRGNIWVENTEAIVEGDAVYIELDGTGANAGKFYKTASATRVKMPSNMFMWRRPDHDAIGPWSASDGNVAQLSVNLNA